MRLIAFKIFRTKAACLIAQVLPGETLDRRLRARIRTSQEVGVLENKTNADASALWPIACDLNGTA